MAIDAGLLDLLGPGLVDLDRWRAKWLALAADETTVVSPELAAATITELMRRLEDNYPFGNPAYAGQMLKPPPAIASVAYFLTQQINPNNHALDGGPATAAMEREVVADLAAMFGFDPAASLGHLTPAARSPISKRSGSRASSTQVRRSRSPPTRTTPTRACARRWAWKACRSRSTAPDGWISTR